MPNWKKLVVSGSDASLNSLNIQHAVTASYFVGDGSNLTNISVDVAQIATVSDTFSSVTETTITHSFDTKNIIVNVYDDSDRLVLPDSIITSDNNTVSISFSEATTGRAVVAKGGHIVQYSGNSNTLNSQSGSYYLDYSNFTNIPNGIVSSSNQISNLTTYRETISGSNLYTITHNLNEDYPIVQVYNTSRSQVIPAEITTTSANALNLNFNDEFSGTVVVKT